MAVLKNTVNIGDMQVTGDLTASKVKVQGGTSTQAMMADGTLATLSTVAQSGSYNDLTNKPSIPSAANSGTLQISSNNNSAVNTLFNANSQSATNAIKFVQSGATTITASAASGSNPATITISSTDTKNTAGSTDSTSKLFLIGATSQDNNPQTYSNSSVFATNGNLTANTFTSNVATGTAPLAVTSTTAVTNLNADMLDGYHSSDFSTSSHTHTLTINEDSTSSSQLDLVHNTKYKLTAGGSTFVFKTPTGSGSMDADLMHMNLPVLFLTYGGSDIKTYSFNDVLSLIQIIKIYCSYYSITQTQFPGVDGTTKMYDEIRAINMPIYIRWDELAYKKNYQYAGETIDTSTPYNAGELNAAPCGLAEYSSSDVWSSAYRLSTVGFIRMYLFDSADLLHIEIDLGGGKKLVSYPKGIISSYGIPASKFITDIAYGWREVLAYFQTYGSLQWETIDIFNNQAGTTWH